MFNNLKLKHKNNNNKETYWPQGEKKIVHLFCGTILWPNICTYVA